MIGVFRSVQRVGSGLVLLVLCHCGKAVTSGNADPSTTESDAGVTAGAGGSNPATTSGPSAGGTTSEGGSSSGGTAGGGSAGAGQTPEGLAGAAGTAADEHPLCTDLLNDNGLSECTPKLRAIVSTLPDVGTMTFQYDDAGRLVTVGDERPHTEYYSSRYTYDSEGRLVQYERNCDPEEPVGTCDDRTEYSYRSDGTLETEILRVGDEIRSETSYDEKGRTTSIVAGLSVRVYAYDNAGLLTTVDVYENDAYVGSWEYSYNDAGQLLRVAHSDPVEEGWTEEYVYEDGQLVAATKGDFYSVSTYYFDELGHVGISTHDVEGDHIFYGHVDDSISLYWFRGSDWVTVVRSFDLSPESAATFPFRPYELRADEVVDFAYTDGEDVYRKRYLADDDGWVRLVEFSGPHDQPIASVEIFRCDGSLAEVTHLPRADQDDEFTAFYYGCNDFALSKTTAPSP